MPAELARKWVTLVLGAVVLSTGCVTVTPPAGRGAGSNAPAKLLRQRGAHVQGTEVAMLSPVEMAMRAVASGTRQADAFEYLLLLAGLDNVNDAPPRGAPLTPQEAARIKLIEEHEKKLLQYRTNPLANDHLGKLKNQPPEIQRKVIEGRIDEVERQLKGQRLNLKRVEEVLRTLEGGT